MQTLVSIVELISDMNKLRPQRLGLVEKVENEIATVKNYRGSFPEGKYPLSQLRKVSDVLR